MSPFFASDEDRARLNEVAHAWEGTPWAYDGCARGVAASCSNLAQAVLRDCGLPVPLLRPRAGLSKSAVLPYMISWFDSHAELFAKVPTADIQAGDCLLFDYGMGHVGIAVSYAEMLHVLQSVKTSIVAWRDDRIGSRLIAVYRPLKQNEPWAQETTKP